MLVLAQHNSLAWLSDSNEVSGSAGLADRQQNEQQRFRNSLTQHFASFLSAGIQACFTGFLKAVRVQQQGSCYQICPEAHALQVGVVLTELYNLQSISMGRERACSVHILPGWCRPQAGAHLLLVLRLSTTCRQGHHGDFPIVAKLGIFLTAQSELIIWCHLQPQ